MSSYFFTHSLIEDVRRVFLERFKKAPYLSGWLLSIIKRDIPPCWSWWRGWGDTFFINMPPLPGCSSFFQSQRTRKTRKEEGTGIRWCFFYNKRARTPRLYEDLTIGRISDTQRIFIITETSWSPSGATCLSTLSERRSIERGSFLHRERPYYKEP